MDCRTLVQSSPTNDAPVGIYGILEWSVRRTVTERGVIASNEPLLRRGAPGVLHRVDIANATMSRRAYPDVRR